MSQVAAGWYSDPSLPGTMRWWDGSAWTEHLTPAAAAAPAVVVPVAPAAPAAVPGSGVTIDITRPPGGKPRSTKRVWGLMCVTIGFYATYWFFTMRREMNADLGRTDNALLQTTMVFVPVLKWMAMVKLWNDIDQARQAIGLQGIDVGLERRRATRGGLGLCSGRVIRALAEYWTVREHMYAQSRAGVAIQERAAA